MRTQIIGGVIVALLIIQIVRMQNAPKTAAPSKAQAATVAKASSPSGADAAVSAIDLKRTKQYGTAKPSTTGGGSSSGSGVSSSSGVTSSAPSSSNSSGEVTATQADQLANTLAGLTGGADSSIGGAGGSGGTSGSTGGSGTGSSGSGSSTGSSGSGSGTGVPVWSPGDTSTGSSGLGSSGSTGTGSSTGTGTGSGTGSGTGTGSTGSGGSSGGGTPPELVIIPPLPAGNATDVYGGLSYSEQDAMGVMVMENAYLTYTIDYRNNRIKAFDKRVNHEWGANIAISPLTYGVVRSAARRIDVIIKEPTSGQVWTASVTLDSNSAEVLYDIKASQTSAFSPMDFPPFFNVGPSTEIIVPFSEGLKLPIVTYVQDMPKTSVYGGSWGLPFIGVMEDALGWMEMLETPNDFAFTYNANSAGVTFLNRWNAVKSQFGYDRLLRQVFFDQGGYVAMAKRYRQFASDHGLLVTLQTKKAQRNGNLDKLVGAVDLWYWGANSTGLSQELKDNGLSKVLFSNTPQIAVTTISDLGFLTSKYDIYEEVFPPEAPTIYHEGWPADLVLDSKGVWLPGYTLTSGSTTYTGGLVCSIPALARAKNRVTTDLAAASYSARFIDAATSSPWRECYSSSHPTTTTQDIKNKMDLLSFVSGDKGLVTGSAEGVVDGVPVADYFEGMMSIPEGRISLSGNVGDVVYVPPTAAFMKYQVGEGYRIPLWELVFHEALVSTWWMGDATDRFPEVWWRRDLFNILYGNMPLWAIRDDAHWQKYKTAFIASYHNVSPVLGKVGYEEMLTHAYLTDDHTVQETTFTGNIRIIVNFGETNYPLLSPAVIVRAHGFVVLENNALWKSGVCDYDDAVAPGTGG